MYDKALLDKLRSAFPNTVQAEPDRFFEALDELQKEIKDKGKNVPKLPAMSFYRSQTSVSTPLLNTPARQIGRKLNFTNPEETSVFNGRTIPLRLEYMLELWSKEKSVLNDLIGQMLFYLYRKPNLEIQIPKSQETQVFSIAVDENIMDNTEVSEFDDKGKLYRATLTLIIDDAQLFNVYEKKTVLVVDADIFDGDKLIP